MRFRPLALGPAAAAALLATTASAQVAPPAATPDSVGTGAYPAVKEMIASLPNHVVSRPADLSALGSRKLGILVWGNGACSADGASARHHLAEIASHGYIAIAPGTILSGPGAPPPPPPAPAAHILILPS